MKKKFILNRYLIAIFIVMLTLILSQTSNLSSHALNNDEFLESSKTAQVLKIPSLSTPDKEIFTDNQADYSFEYSPEEWNLEYEQGFEGTTSFVSLMSVSGNESITIVAMPNPEHASAAEWYEKTKFTYNQDLVQVRSDLEIRIGQQDAILLAQPKSCNTVGLLTTIFTTPDTAFTISYFAPDSQKQPESYQQILQSFNINNIEHLTNHVPQLDLPSAIQDECAPINQPAAVSTMCSNADFSVPTEGYVMSAYGCWGGTWCSVYSQADPHKGIDIGPVNPSTLWGNGTPGNINVYASADGYVVNFVGIQGIRLRHNSFSSDTYYAHMGNNATGQSYIQVTVGQTVIGGQSILGKMGNYGTYETHLHFDILIIGGSDLNWAHTKNPTPFLSAEGLAFVVNSQSGQWQRHPMACLPPLTVPSWNFGNDFQGWWIGNSLSSATQYPTGLWFNVIGNDPFIYGPRMNFAAASYPVMRLKMASQTDNCGQVYFTRTGDSGFSEGQSVSLPIIADGATRIYDINMSSHPLWTGNITQLRLDPACQAVNNHVVRIDQLELLNPDQSPPNISYNTPSTTTWYGANQTLSWSVTDSGSGVAYFKWAWDDSSPDNQVNGSNGSTTLSAVGEGQHTLYVQAWDNAGNATGVESRGWFGYDVTAPTNPTSSNAGCTATSGIWQKTCTDPAFTWNGAGDGSGSGVKDYHIYWGTNSSGTPDTWRNTPDFNPGAISTSGGVATYYLRVATRDNVGHEAAAKTLFILRYDNSNPAGSPLINNNAVTVNNINVLVQPQGSDTGSGIAKVRLSNNGTTWQALTPGTAVPWSLLGNNRDWNPVWVQLEDGVGNRSAIYELQTCLDLYPASPSSSSYRLWSGGLAAAGGQGSSTSFRLTDTVGQTASGSLLSSSSYRLQSGFGGGTAVPGSAAYQPFQCGQSGPVYLPMVIRP